MEGGSLFERDTAMAQPITAISRRERDDLAKLTRQRAALAKSQTAQRRAELLAEFEQQMASIYSFDQDATWRRAHEAAAQAVKEAEQDVARRCEALGIPKQFAPGLSLLWYSRGENAVAARRAELRKVAVTRLDAMEKAAKAQIDKRSLEVQTELLAGGLDSAEARRFLASMPTAGALMPRLEMQVVQKALGTRGTEPDDGDDWDDGSHGETLS